MPTGSGSGEPTFDPIVGPDVDPPKTGIPGCIEFTQPQPRKSRPRKASPPGTKGPRHRTRVRGFEPFTPFVSYPQSLTEPPLGGPPEGDSEKYLLLGEEFLLGDDFQLFEDVVGRVASWQNPCYNEHIKVKVNTSAIHALEDMGLPVSVLSLKDTPSFIPRSLIHKATTLPSPGQISDFALYARDRAVDAVSVEADFLAFIGELISGLSGLIDTLGKVGTLWQRIVATVTRHYHKLRRSKPHLSDAACWWLAWTFGICPFVRDLEALGKTYTKARKRLAWLQEREGKPTIVKSGRKFSNLPIKGSYEIMDLGWNGGASAGSLRQGIRVTQTACQVCKAANSSLVRFHLPGGLLDGLPGQGMVFLRMLGVYNPIASAWELTPFSWLVDWFVGYKNKLQMDSLDWFRQFIVHDAEFLGSVSSLHVVAQGNIDWLIDDGLTQTAISIGSYEIGVYWRIPGDFSTEFAPQLNGLPFIEQWATLLSLAVQKFSKRPK